MIKTDNYSDNHLRSMLQKYLTKNHRNNPKTKNLRLCGSQVIKQIGTLPACFLISNGQQVRFFGVTSCHSSWACPTCTPKQMAQYGAKIANLIDAMETWYKKSAFMMTLTMPHTNHLSCKESLDVLQNAWRRFARSGNHKDHTDLRRDATGQKRRGNDPLAKMREELNIRHFVKVIECNWGEKSGWHPHIHMLMWVDKADLQKVANYEELLLDRWWTCCKLATKSVLKDRFHEKSIDQFYADWRKYPKTGHRSLFISKTDDGKIRAEKSSHYITGWGGDNEITQGYHKLGRNGHYSPFQLLQKHLETKDDKWIELYVEFAQATHGKRRVQFSNSGLNTIIQKWRMSNEYIEAFKKKAMDKAQETWKVVAWFTEKQWSFISAFDAMSNDYIKSTILKLATKPNAKKLIAQFLAKYGIGLYYYEHPDQDQLEQMIFENTLPSCVG